MTILHHNPFKILQSKQTTQPQNPLLHFETNNIDNADDFQFISNKLQRETNNKHVRFHNRWSLIYKHPLNVVKISLFQYLKDILT